MNATSWISHLLLGRLFLGAIFCLFFSACSVLGGPLREDTKASGYQLKTPRNWSAVNPEVTQSTADRIYRTAGGEAMIALNSLCHRYESTSLERLARQYESGLRDAVSLGDEELMIDGRRAYRLHLKGNYDGVPSEMIIVVLRKNECLFDFSLVGVSPLSERVIKEFRSWSESFRYDSSSAEETR